MDFLILRPLSPNTGYHFFEEGGGGDGGGVGSKVFTQKQGGGGALRNPIAWGVLKPPPLFKNGPRGCFKGVFRRRHIICAIFFGGILLDCTARVLSLPPIQPLLILSP